MRGDGGAVVFPLLQRIRVTVDRHPGVVEHDRNVFVAAGEIGRLSELAREHLQVEGEPELAERREPLQPGGVGDEVGAVAVSEYRVGMPVQDVAYTPNG